MPNELDPDGMVKRLLEKLEQRRSPNDPFNRVIDDLKAHIRAHPEAFAERDPAAHLGSYLRMVSDKLQATVAQRLGAPWLMEPENLVVNIEHDWRLNAAVQALPPYSLFVSFNLFLFCARFSELLVSGLGLDITGETDGATIATAQPQLSTAEISQRVKAALDEFIAHRTIPATNLDLMSSHYTLQQIVVFSIMAFILGHEFGHVVINETRNRGDAPPFSDFAEQMLQSNFEGLLKSGRHDPENRTGLRDLTTSQSRQVFANWVTEINADILGASLAAEYQRNQGPWKGGPQIVGWTYLSIHLCFIAQMFLYLYWNLQDPQVPLISATHPPMDFRMHCLLQWMYKGDRTSEKPVTEYSQEILNGVIELAQRERGRPRNLQG
ncbi:MAG: hypothetical protein AB7I09_18165 [Planctomycetota bacterium]